MNRSRFFGVAIKPGKKHSYKYDPEDSGYPLQLKHACLGPAAGDDQKASLVLATSEHELCLGTMRAGGKSMIPLDFTFTEPMTFEVRGQAEVHVSGLILSMDEDWLDEGDEDEDESASESEESEIMERETQAKLKEKLNQTFEIWRSDGDSSESGGSDHEDSDDSSGDGGGNGDVNGIKSDEIKQRKKRRAAEPIPTPEPKKKGKIMKDNALKIVPEESGKAGLVAGGGADSKVFKFENGFVLEKVAENPKGKLVQRGRTVVVRYVGRFHSSKKVFDQTKGKSTFKFKFGLGEVIKGWDQGMEGMRTGEKRKLVIPPQMAYGAQGVRGAIPPNSTLEFDVELVKVL